MNNSRIIKRPRGPQFFLAGGLSGSLFRHPEPILKPRINTKSCRDADQRMVLCMAEVLQLGYNWDRLSGYISFPWRSEESDTFSSDIVSFSEEKRGETGNCEGKQLRVKLLDASLHT